MKYKLLIITKTAFLISCALGTNLGYASNTNPKTFYCPQQIDCSNSLDTCTAQGDDIGYWDDVKLGGKDGDLDSPMQKGIYTFHDASVYIIKSSNENITTCRYAICSPSHTSTLPACSYALVRTKRGVFPPESIINKNTSWATIDSVGKKYKLTQCQSDTPSSCPFLESIGLVAHLGNIDFPTITATIECNGKQYYIFNDTPILPIYYHDDYFRSTKQCTVTLVARRRTKPNLKPKTIPVGSVVIDDHMKIMGASASSLTPNYQIEIDEKPSNGVKVFKTLP